MIFEMVVYCGALKVFRILNVSTGSLYCMNYETEIEAQAAIEEGTERAGKIVKRVKIDELRRLLSCVEKASGGNR